MILARLILGLLSIAPMTGYDIKKHLDTTISHFWAADKAQVYRTLAGLVDSGHATVQVMPQEKAPARQLHHITPSGRALLREWLTSEPERLPEREPFLARLFFASELDRGGVAELLENRRADAEKLLAELEGMRAEQPEPKGDRGLFLRLATLENGITHARADLDWVERTMRELP
ncbi:PadR family transcriptional regulator [Okibacterium endophyticum]